MTKTTWPFTSVVGGLDAVHAVRHRTRPAMRRVLAFKGFIMAGLRSAHWARKVPREVPFDLGEAGGRWGALICAPGSLCSGRRSPAVGRGSREVDGVDVVGFGFLRRSRVRAVVGCAFVSVVAVAGCSSRSAPIVTLRQTASNI